MFMAYLFTGFRGDEEPHPAGIMPFHCKHFFSFSIDDLCDLIRVMFYR